MSLIDFSARTIPPHLIRKPATTAWWSTCPNRGRVPTSAPSRWYVNTPTTYAHQARFIHYTLATKPVNELVEAAD